MQGPVTSNTTGKAATGPLTHCLIPYVQALRSASQALLAGVLTCMIPGSNQSVRYGCLDLFLPQFLETWVPDHQPCQICMCLSGRKINCTAQPCPTARGESSLPGVPGGRRTLWVFSHQSYT
jgi:hypothetical protein